MIHLMAPRLLLLGTQKISFQTFEEVINDHQKLKYTAIAFRQGLRLVRVRYPYLDVEQRMGFEPIIK